MATLVGIDPGTKKCGLVVFDSESKEIALQTVVISKHTDFTKRIQEIVHSIALQIIFLENDPKVYIEKFAMQGIAGEMLHKFVGAVIYAVHGMSIKEVRNTTIKKQIAGHGHAEKEDVALGVLSYFAENARSAIIIEKLIEDKEWDVTDAFAIAIAGWIQDGN